MSGKLNEKITLTYLGFGGNIGNVKATFSLALDELENHPLCTGISCSKLYQTTAWGEIEQPDFLNLVVQVKWNGTIGQLYLLTSRLEEEAGRDRENETRWGPRVLDIDILIFGEMKQKIDSLEIPHPRISQRRFVLQPLVDLDAELQPPGWKHTVQEALEICEDSGEVVLYS